MFDLPAMPIAFALTLWDAVPIYLSVSLAFAVAVRAVLSGNRFTSAWRLREAVGLEGVVYSALFMPTLVPILVISSIVQSVSTTQTPESMRNEPYTPSRALRVRVEEVVFPVLLASAVAAYLKVAGPDASQYGLMLQLVVAVVAGAITGNRSGAVAIPAVAVMVHLGGAVPAIGCVLAATLRHLAEQRRSFSVTSQV